MITKVFTAFIFPTCAIMLLVILARVKLYGLTSVAEPNTTILNAELALFAIFSLFALFNLVYTLRKLFGRKPIDKG